MKLRIMLAVLVFAAPAGFAQDHWVGTWAAAPMGVNNPGGKFGVGVKPVAPAVASADAPVVVDATPGPGSTLRLVVHASIGGGAVRVVFTNEFGVDPLVVGGATVGATTAGGGVEKAVPLAFAGRAGVTIPPGALMVSDPVAMSLKAFSNLSISLFLPEQPINKLSMHPAAYQTSYLVAGNAVTSLALETPQEIRSWDFIKEVEVLAPVGAGAVVAFGDSITDGALSTRDANHRWPDVLAMRLAANKKTAGLAVLNEGIGGNRVLHDTTGPSALARFDRDVLGLAGVKYLILMESINDIGHAMDPVKPYDVVTAEDLIAGFQQMVLRAHAHGIKVIGATLTPYGGAKYASPAGEVARKAVNTWIRTSPMLDGVIDFEKATEDPANPGVFLPLYDSGDHLHPRDAGYKAMGDSIDLRLFEK